MSFDTPFTFSTEVIFMHLVDTFVHFDIKEVLGEKIH